MTNRLVDVFILMGRAGLASLFILGGVNKVLSYSDTLDRMAHSGLPVVTLLLPLVIFLEIAGGLLLVSGKLFVIPAAVLLSAFTVLTNIFFHDFWNMDGESAAAHLSMFFKNVSIASALILFAGMTLQASQQRHQSS